MSVRRWETKSNPASVITSRVRIGLIEGRYIVNPTYDEVRESA